MRKAILAKYLNVSADRIYDSVYGAAFNYTDLETDYLVLTEEEADREARKQVWSFIFSFEVEFLNEYLPVIFTQEDFDKLMRSSCDCCQNMILRLMPEAERFLDDAVQRYGRAYFLCFADKTEYRFVYKGRGYCIYRLV